MFSLHLKMPTKFTKYTLPHEQHNLANPYVVVKKKNVFENKIWTFCLLRLKIGETFVCILELKVNYSPWLHRRVRLTSIWLVTSCVLVDSARSRTCCIFHTATSLVACYLSEYRLASSNQPTSMFEALCRLFSVGIRISKLIVSITRVSVTMAFVFNWDTK